MARKRSFFEKLTGSIHLDEEENSLQEHEAQNAPGTSESDEEGQLAVDVYQTPHEIIIKAMIAGVNPEDLDVAISREVVVIKGRRAEDEHVEETDYFSRELYWGAFSRTIALPKEIETEEAEATENHGLLTIKLPKIDKDKQTTLKVKSMHT